ncbi:MAG: sensor histidine kinase [Opitutaceae bacterium]
MVEIKIKATPKLNSSEERTTDLHSLINVLNVISIFVSGLELEFEDYEQNFSHLRDKIKRLSQDFRTEDNLLPMIQDLRQTKSKIIDQLHTIADASQTEEERLQIQSATEHATSIYNILNVRLDELAYRLDDPDVQISIHQSELTAQMKEILDAIEKYANGRYHIRYNLALKEERDYYIDLKIEAIDRDGVLHMPLRLMDVMRDLLANARKYTKPGGKVALAVYQHDRRIECTIEDTGCGIPEEELSRVSEFGYRATNVRDRRTLGGGYGLTKAVWLIHRWGGSFSIASQEAVGTRIRISVPSSPLTHS